MPSRKEVAGAYINEFILSDIKQLKSHIGVMAMVLDIQLRSRREVFEEDIMNKASEELLDAYIMFRDFMLCFKGK